ncbi:Inner membrane protein yqiK [Serratia fonticola]|uniref:Inner membrane protein yqiK n=1 Tax=Serratia fonticola TaxID=47917 RepID=A0A4U9VLJ7_SERFO|nr:Inner membrane protein yqiK [Serratia fonticola]
MLPFPSHFDAAIDSHPDITLGENVFAHGLSWLHIGRLPLLVIIVLFLGGFSLSGLILQWLAGGELPVWLAVIVAFIVAVFSVRWCGRGIARYLPRDESSAVSTDSFVGRMAIMTSATATAGSPAEARLTDEHGAYPLHFDRAGMRRMSPLCVEPRCWLRRASPDPASAAAPTLGRTCCEHGFNGIIFDNTYGEVALVIISDGLTFWGSIAGGIFVVLLIIGLIFSRLYRRASAEQSLVRTGLGGLKVVLSGGAISLPVFHEIVEINMKTLKLEVSRAMHDSLITKDRMRVDVVVAFFVRVQPTIEGISTAAQTLGQRTLSPEDLRQLVEDKFVDALRSTAAQMTMQDLQDTRENFVQGVQSTVSEDLAKNGLELESVSLTNFNQTSKEYFDPNNAFDAEGLTKLTQETERRRRERNEVEQDVEVAVREKNRDAMSRKLEIEQQEAFMSLEQEQQVKTRSAEQSSRIATFEAERRREAEQSRISAERQIQEAEIEREQAVRTRKVEAEREIRVKEIEQNKVTEMAAIEQKKVTEIAEQDKAIAIAAKSEQQSQAQARANDALTEAVKAEQNVETTRQTAEADRAKQVCSDRSPSRGGNRGDATDAESPCGERGG